MAKAKRIVPDKSAKPFDLCFWYAASVIPPTDTLTFGRLVGGHLDRDRIAPPAPR
jgi:hypothetical protein